MNIPNSRATAPPASVSRARPVDEARQWATSAIGLIAHRTGCTRPEALTALARSAKVASGTLENLSRERLKRMAVEDYVGIQAAFIAEINRNIGLLEAELELARARGAAGGAAGADLGAACAALEQARAALKKHI